MVRFDVLGTIDLRGVDGRPLHSILAQHKRLALLGYLLLARPFGFHRRDALAALLWGDLDTRRARAALSRAVYVLRRELGAGAVVRRGEEELAVDLSTLACDAVRFENLVAAGDWARALELYRGDLMTGFFVSDGSPEFDQWLEARRAELREHAADAAWRLALQAGHAGDDAAAVRAAQRHLALRPGDEAALRNVLEIMGRTGNAAAAAQLYRDFVRRLADEFDLEPSPETQRAFAGLTRPATPGAAGAAARAEPAPTATLPDTALASASRAEPAPRTRWSARTRAWASAAALLVLTVIGWRVTAARDADRPVLAVGDIVAASPGDSAPGFATLLTTNLGRIERLEVVSERRMAQLLARTGADAHAAALAAGADEFLEGTLVRRGDAIRLDLRRTHARSGQIRAAYTIEARDHYDLVDLVVEHLARDLGLSAPADRPGAATASLIAYRLYEEGLRAYYRNDQAGARRLFEAALAEDSTFAMAAYFLALAISAVGMDEYFDLAARLADRSNDRERLLILTRRGIHLQDPRARVWAESLAVRFPDDLEGRLAYATVLRVQSERAAAIPHWQHVIARDSANIGVTAHCHACEAIHHLSETYALMDSLPAAERTIRIWLRHDPSSGAAWHRLAAILERAGLHERQAAAVDSALDRDGGGGLVRLNRLVRIGQFDSVDSAVRGAVNSELPGVRAEGLWSLVGTARLQGRLSEALEAAREYRRLRMRQGAADPTGEAFVEAIVLLETGRHREAAELFESIAGNAPVAHLSRIDSHRVTWLTYAATAWAAAGDTARLAAIEDEIRARGARSLSAAQRRRHHYVRALRLEAQARPADAAASFARALADHEDDHALIHLGHARAAIAAGRHAEAIEQLRIVLRGPVGGAGWAVPRTEFQALLGHAFEATGQADSALAYYSMVLRAWRNAEPRLEPRRRAIQGALDRLTDPERARSGREATNRTPP